MQTADEKFSIDGVGFLWQQTNSTLLVSNQVHTIIHPEQLGPQTTTATTNVAAEQTPPKAKQASGIDVFSDQFEYAQNSGLGVYQGNVRVAGTNLTSTSGRLTIVMSVTERLLQSLTAEQNVIIDYETIHATGERAFYSADTGLVQLTGPPMPTWRMEEKEGSGDQLVFDRTNRVFNVKRSEERRV